MKALFAAGLLLGTSSFALAADPGMPMEEPPAGFNWTGGYVGAQLGYGWGDAYQTSDGDYSFPDPDGWLGGVYVGYNYQFSNKIVLGVDADFAWSGADGDSLFFSSAGAPYSDAFVGYLDVKWSGAARARAGYAFDRFLPYIAGGIAFAEADWTYTTRGVVNQTANVNYVGWTIGAGGEYAFTDNLIGRAEYRYTDFGNETYPPSNGFYEGSIDLKSSDIRLGIAYKF